MSRRVLAVYLSIARALQEVTRPFKHRRIDAENMVVSRDELGQERHVHAQIGISSWTHAEHKLDQRECDLGPFWRGRVPFPQGGALGPRATIGSPRHAYIYFTPIKALQDGGNAGRREPRASVHQEEGGAAQTPQEQPAGQAAKPTREGIGQGLFGQGVVTSGNG